MLLSLVTKVGITFADDRLGLEVSEHGYIGMRLL